MNHNPQLQHVGYTADREPEQNEIIDTEGKIYTWSDTHDMDLIREYANKIKAEKHDETDVQALANLITENTAEVEN